MSATSTRPDARSPRAEARSIVSDVGQRLFFALVLRPILMLWVGLRVRGREQLPAADPFILIANHSSHLDTASLLSLFPGRRLKRIRAVAAADYFERNRLVSRLTRTLFHTLPIARKDFTPETDPRTTMLAAVDRGYSLILFPEGTRGSGEEIGRFKKGVAHLVERRPDVPVVPVYLHNMGRSLPKGELLPVPIFCEARIGVPRRPRGTQEEIVRELEEAVRALKAEG